jgi:hypothetical protein
MSTAHNHKIVLPTPPASLTATFRLCRNMLRIAHATP